MPSKGAITLRNLSERRPFSVIGHAFSNLLMHWGGGGRRGRGASLGEKGGIKGLETYVSVAGRTLSP